MDYFFYTPHRMRDYDMTFDDTRKDTTMVPMTGSTLSWRAYVPR
jgi:hypothetical protein